MLRVNYSTLAADSGQCQWNIDALTYIQLVFIALMEP